MADVEQNDLDKMVQEGVQGRQVRLRDFAAAARKYNPTDTSGLDDRGVFKFIAKHNPNIDFGGMNVLLDEAPAAASPTTQPAAPAAPAAQSKPATPSGTGAPPDPHAAEPWLQRVIGGFYDPTYRGGLASWADESVNRITGGARQMAQPGMRTKAAGLHEAIGGAFEAAEPIMAAEGVRAPIAAAKALGGGLVSQAGVEEILKRLGVPAEYSSVIGDVTGLVVGARSGRRGAPKEAPGTASPPPPTEPGPVVSRETATPAAAAPAAPKTPAQRHSDIVEVLRREAAADPKMEVKWENIATILGEGHGKNVTPAARTKANRILSDLVNDGVISSSRKVMPAGTAAPQAGPIPPAVAALAAAVPKAEAGPAPVAAPAKPATAPAAAPPTLSPEDAASMKALFPEPDAPAAPAAPAATGVFSRPTAESPASSAVPVAEVSAGRNVATAVPQSVLGQASALGLQGPTPAEHAVGLTSTPWKPGDPVFSERPPATAQPPAEPVPPPVAAAATPASAAAAPAETGTAGPAFSPEQEAALARMKAKWGGQRGSMSWKPLTQAEGLPVLEKQDLQDLYSIGRAYLDHYGHSFADWSRGMVGALGEAIQGYLKPMWDNLHPEITAATINPGAGPVATPEAGAATARTGAPPVRPGWQWIEKPTGNKYATPILDPSRISPGGGMYAMPIEGEEPPRWDQIFAEGPPPSPTAPPPRAIPGEVGSRPTAGRPVEPQAKAAWDQWIKDQVQIGRDPKAIEDEARAMQADQKIPPTLRSTERAAVTPAQEAEAKRISEALSYRPPPLPTEEVARRIAQGQAARADWTAADWAAARKQDEILRSRTGASPVAAGPSSKGAPEPIPYPKYDYPAQATYPIEQALTKSGFQERNLSQMSKEFERQHTSGKPSAAREPIARELPSGNLASKVWSKPVSDGVIEFQWDPDTHEFEASKYYNDTGEFRTATGVGPEQIVDYLNRVQQREQPVRAGQRSGRSYGGGTPFVPARGSSAPPPAEAAPEAVAAQKLQGTLGRAEDPVALESVINAINSRAETLQHPELTAEIARLKSERRQLRKVQPQASAEPTEAPPAAEDLPHTLPQQLYHDRTAPLTGNEALRQWAATAGRIPGPGGSGPPVFRAEGAGFGGGLYTAEQGSAPSPELNAQAWTKLNDDHISRIIADAAARVQKSGPAAARPAEAPAKPAGRRLTQIPEESAFDVKETVGGNWRVEPKAGGETNVFISKGPKSKFHNVYVGNRLITKTSTLTAAKLEAVKVAEQELARHIKRTAGPFRVANVGAYAPLGETAEGMRYQFTSERGGESVERIMPIAMWEHLQQTGEPFSPVAEQPRPVGRPRAEADPPVTFTPPKSPLEMEMEQLRAENEWLKSGGREK